MLDPVNNGNPNNFKIRRATFNDISFMLALERECPTAAHWTEQQYRQLFSDRENKLERLVLIAEEPVAEGPANLEVTSNPHFWQDPPEMRHPRFFGFLVARQVDSEWELENVVVEAAARRKGIGGDLVSALLSCAEESGGASVFLEVRESNLAARKLYEKAGFEPTGRRKSYYSSPSEDALTYLKYIK